jgi:hypothetical protein
MTTQPLDERVILPVATTDEWRAFARVMKAALLMIVRYLEHRYHV